MGALTKLLGAIEPPCTLLTTLLVRVDRGDELGTGVCKHILLLSLLKPGHLVLEPLFELGVYCFIHILQSQWYVKLHVVLSQTSKHAV